MHLPVLSLLIGFAYFYSHVFSGRAAFIHFGAMIGSIMVANVFFVIIPSQKAMVNAAKKGQLPDPQKGKNALFRSIHNNYFTLPVLFVMVSNHFPSTFGNKYQWIVLAAISYRQRGYQTLAESEGTGKIKCMDIAGISNYIIGRCLCYCTATIQCKMQRSKFCRSQ